MSLRSRIAKLEGDSAVEDNAGRQGVIEVSSVEFDPQKRAPGIYRREDGWILCIVFQDDEEHDRLLESVRDELAENLLIIEMGPIDVPRPIDDIIDN